MIVHHEVWKYSKLINAHHFEGLTRLLKGFVNQIENFVSEDWLGLSL